MYYILESERQIQRLEELVKDPIYIEVVSSNDLYHPKLSYISAIYIRPVDQESGYIVPIQHGDANNVGLTSIYQILLKAPTLYTLNKKTLLYHLNLQKAIDVSLLYSMKHFKKLEYKSSNQIVEWYYRQYDSKRDINSIIPISKLYQRCEIGYESIEPFISEICINNSTIIPTGFDFYNNTATNVFFLIEQNGIGIIEEDFNEVHKPRNPVHNTHNSSVYSLYNLYNATSRPTNNFNSVNFAAINKSEEYRKCFKPKNNYFVEFDFDGYHLRLLSDQINYPLTEESAHKQLAKNYFDTDNITEEQYNLAKQINFQAIYGKIPDEHNHLPIFKSIQAYIDVMWEIFEKEGYVTDPQSGKPFTKELKEMHPAKLMNYMMQSLETSNNITILKEVLRYLQDKKTFITLYTYDAILFDFSKEDGKETLEDIKRIMELGNKYPVKFKYSTDLVL